MTIGIYITCDRCHQAGVRQDKLDAYEGSVMVRYGSRYGISTINDADHYFTTGNCHNTLGLGDSIAYYGTFNDADQLKADATKWRFGGNTHSGSDDDWHHRHVCDACCEALLSDRNTRVEYPYVTRLEAALCRKHRRDARAAGLSEDQILTDWLEKRVALIQHQAPSYNPSRSTTTRWCGDLEELKSLGIFDGDK